MGLLHARDTGVRIVFLGVKSHENHDAHIKKVWNPLLSPQFAYSETRIFEFAASAGSFLVAETWNEQRQLAATSATYSRNLLRLAETDKIST